MKNNLGGVANVDFSNWPSFQFLIWGNVGKEKTPLVNMQLTDNLLVIKKVDPESTSYKKNETFFSTGIRAEDIFTNDSIHVVASPEMKAHIGPLVS